MRPKKPETLKVGDEFGPVFWETDDGREPGQHMARILAILPYKGRYDCFCCVVRLHAPKLMKGWTESAATKYDMMKVET
jgi:hypothetical protein